MRTPWIYLVERYGSEMSNPKEADLRRALDQLYTESVPGMTDADYEEHGSAWLRLGFDEGPMYVLTTSRTGRTTFEHWLDQDYEVEACAPINAEAVSYEVAWSLWLAFSSANVEGARVRLQELNAAK